MIKKISDLLHKLSEKEIVAIEKHGIKHGPTIGDMYEGLTKKILDSAIPAVVDLSVRSGFVTDGKGKLSRQIDCMVVTGAGEKISNVSEYIYHVKDVIAVVEVKKNLYSADLNSAHQHQNDVFDVYKSYSKLEGFEEFNPFFAAREFLSLFGKLAPQYHLLDSSDLSNFEKSVYHALVMEQLPPLRIVLGYNGFQSEHGLRDAYFNLLNKNMDVKGYGVNNIPQLIISNGFSLIKTNGMPYLSSIQKGGWEILSSSNVNPIYLLLEILITKIERFFGIAFDWGEDLREEKLVHFIAADISEKNGRSGWQYTFNDFDKKFFDERQPYAEWSPMIINKAQYEVVKLLDGEDDKLLNLHDSKIQSIANEFELSIHELILLGRKTNLVATDSGNIFLTASCGLVELEGRYYVANNSTGRFTRWLNSLKSEYTD